MSSPGPTRFVVEATRDYWTSAGASFPAEVTKTAGIAIVGGYGRRLTVEASAAAMAELVQRMGERVRVEAVVERKPGV